MAAATAEEPTLVSRPGTGTKSKDFEPASRLGTGAQSRTGVESVITPPRRRRAKRVNERRMRSIAITTLVMLTFLTRQFPNSPRGSSRAFRSLSKPFEAFWKPFEAFRSLSKLGAFRSLSKPFEAFRSLSKPLRAFQRLLKRFKAFRSLSTPFEVCRSLLKPFEAFRSFLKCFAAL